MYVDKSKISSKTNMDIRLWAGFTSQYNGVAEVLSPMQRFCHSPLKKLPHKFHMDRLSIALWSCQPQHQVSRIYRRFAYSTFMFFGWYSIPCPPTSLSICLFFSRQLRKWMIFNLRGKFSVKMAAWASLSVSKRHYWLLKCGHQPSWHSWASC